MTGCYRSSAYRGDGKIVAVRLGNWLMSCKYYGISLGSINLTKKSKKTFAMQGLPPEVMCLGFRTKPYDQNVRPEDREENKSDAFVRVLLVDDAGRTVIDEEECLTRWTWSYAGGEPSFVYQRGHFSSEGKETLGVIDEAHGTYFKPRTKVKYTLTVEIIEPDSKGRYDDVNLEMENLCW